jgi:hypothetical protein
MKRNIYPILYLLFSFLTLHADDPQRSSVETSVVLLYQGYTINSYNATGFSNAIHSTLADLPDANPASLSDLAKPGIGLSMEYQTKIDNALGYSSFKVGHKRIKQYIPQSVTIIYPIRFLQVGMGFYQKYSDKMDFGKIAIMSLVNPDSATGHYEPDYRRYIYSGNAIISRNLSNFFGKDHHIYLGLQLNVDFFRLNDSILNTTISASDQAFSWKIGIKYTYQNKLSLAAIFDKGNSFSGKYKYENEPIVVIDTSSFFQGIQIEHRFKLNTPSKFILGYEVKPLPWLWVHGSGNLVYWNQANSYYKNNFDYSFGFIFNGEEKLAYSFGVFNVDRKTRNSSPFVVVPDYSGYYLSAGIMARFKSWTIQGTIMDSHISSSEIRKQTIGKLGLEYIF